MFARLDLLSQCIGANINMDILGEKCSSRNLTILLLNVKPALNDLDDHHRLNHEIQWNKICG